ncbi:gamma-aminobutyric acid receptor alpha-like [Chrysoperla carnea]|uniref:gamma-aminobutyric acid receptor alpha-like n=1 Tax=Chrysoperla carnea TaxID=189513 RepID=UPI001D0662DF|nr:gamma-aminobutyric acid receptor alpha-like [Chrysoperla carnea]
MFKYLIYLLIIWNIYTAILCTRNINKHNVKQANNHKNISTLLNNLLRGYDNSVRPDFGGPPAIVEVDIMVRSMGPISEVDMTYSMDCYFRQSWVDRRLAFQGNGQNETLALSISMLKRIWKPDTYFYNGKQSYLHTITTPNKFVRLHQNGRVLYSSRLTIKAGCPMNLEDFPMDTQRCPLKFGSFGYTVQDVIYTWNNARQIAIADDMKLSQFDLIATPAANQTDIILASNPKQGRSAASKATFVSEYSMLLVSFHLQRHMGNFLIQVYGPCVLLVVLSWVSFWLNREATADRVSLGITTVLTMTFLGLEARTDLPKVPYPTALDFFVFLSFAFIFATIIQFAIVHYFTKYGSGECYFSTDFSSESSSDEEEWSPICEIHKKTDSMKSSRVNRKNSNASNSKRNGSNMNPHQSTSSTTNDRLIEVIPLSACTMPITKTHHRRGQWNTFDCLCCASPSISKASTPAATKPETQNPYAPSTVSCIENQRHHSLSSGSHQYRRKKKKRTPRFNSVSKIDRISRIMFPLLFFTINVFYWYSYLSRSERIHHSKKGI